jgi:hypothetical protein
MRANHDSAKVCFPYFCFSSGADPDKKKAQLSVSESDQTEQAEIGVRRLLD